MSLGTDRHTSASAAVLELLLRAASSAVAATPTDNRYVLADTITSVVPSLAPRLFSRTWTNYARAFSVSRSRAQSLARLSIRNFGRMAVDFLWVRTLSNAQVESITQLAGDKYLWGALAAGRGVILVLPHVGCWDVAAARSSAAGLHIAIVTESTRQAQLASASRRRPGITLVHRDRSLRVLLRALQHNEGVALLSDLARKGLQTEKVAFFGNDARFPTGPGRLSERTNAPVVAVTCVRTSSCRYRVEFRPPIWPRAVSASEIVGQIAREFEALISRYPDQWYPFGHIWAST